MVNSRETSLGYPVVGYIRNSLTHTISRPPDEPRQLSAFWSVTNYDEEGYLEANAENRYSLGSNHKLAFNPDGSLDFYLSNSRPDIAEVNWVPAPRGNFKTLLRIYWPKQQVLRGEWDLPPIKKVSGTE